MEAVGDFMTGCRRQCDWDEHMVCRSCGIDYSDPNDETKESVKESKK